MAAAPCALPAARPSSSTGCSRRTSAPPSRGFTKLCSTPSPPAATSRATSCARPIRRSRRFIAEVAAPPGRRATNSCPRPAPITRSGTARRTSPARRRRSRSTGRPTCRGSSRSASSFPPSNDIDVYTQDLGFIAIAGGEGSKASTSRSAAAWAAPTTSRTPIRGSPTSSATSPRTSCSRSPDAVMSVQRDYGNRADRNRARFKYTIDDKGLDWIKARSKPRLGAPLEPARPFHFISNGDTFGWRETETAAPTAPSLSRTAASPTGPAVPAGRPAAIARLHRGDVPGHPEPESDRRRRRAGGPAGDRGAAGRARPRRRTESALRRNSIACVALPTCGARHGRERALPARPPHPDRGDPRRPRPHRRADHLPDQRLPERLLAALCRRDRADRPGARQVQSLPGRRLPRRAAQQDVPGERRRADDPRGARDSRPFRPRPQPDERFGDFAIRAGYVAEVTEGRVFND